MNMTININKGKEVIEHFEKVSKELGYKIQFEDVNIELREEKKVIIIQGATILKL